MINENIHNTRLTSATTCLADLNKLAFRLQLDLEAYGDVMWEDGEYTSSLINPVAHRLLDHQPCTSSGSMTQPDLISEALRLGAIIWIMQVMRRCRSYPDTAEARVSTLLRILSGDHLVKNYWNSADLRAVRAWLLVLCSICEPTEGDLVTAMRMIASEMRELNVISWNEIMVQIRQMPWLELFEPLCAQLWERLLKDHLVTSAANNTRSTTL